ncbi:MAG: ABC transporter permease [Bacteroidales bacterium]|nr:ABC transporter permease [Bacteroidales bacterium]
MKKIILVLKREYSTRIRKKSFWFITILVPILIATLYVVPIYLSLNSIEKTNIIVVDETMLFKHFRSNEEVRYTHIDDIDEAKNTLKTNTDYSTIIYIPRTESRIPSDAYLYYYSNNPPTSVKNDIQNQLERILKNNILLEVYDIAKSDYDMINNATIHIHSKDLETGRDDFLEVKTVLGGTLGILIYLVIFIFGSQVMRGVVEEKTNRIVEVIVSSVKPFQLMMGKIIGIAMVGLTQFLLWIAISMVILGAVQWSGVVDTDLFVAQHNDGSAMQTVSQLPDVIQGILSINFGVILSTFLFFFILGYLLYATLFAAAGAMIGNETDSQQFTLPITIPLLLTILLIPLIVASPNGNLAFWLSVIPFTSPVAMMVRLPFGLPIWQVWMSAVILLITFLAATWVAAKIYRTGILMYGKRITYKEVLKWLKYKN